MLGYRDDSTEVAHNWPIPNVGLPLYLPLRPYSYKLIRGGAALRDASLFVHNLQGGFDRYDVNTGAILQHYDTPSVVENNVPLSVLSMLDGDLLFGSNCGAVRMSDLSGGMVQTLTHGGTRAYPVRSSRIRPDTSPNISRNLDYTSNGARPVIHPY